MRIILKENIDNLGRKGDIVDVASGYGRNFLIPKKLALEVTPSNMKMIEMEQLALRKKFEQEKSTYQDLIDKLNETRLTFIRKTAEKDVIFGSVSSADIRDALSEQGMDVDKKKVLLTEPIKRLGNYAIPIKVFHDERAEVKIEVVTEEKERPLEKTKDRAEEEAMDVKKEGADKEEVEAGKKQEKKKETAETAIVVPEGKEENQVKDAKPEESTEEKAEKEVAGTDMEEEKGETAETVLAEPKKDTKETAETAVMISEEEKEEGEEDRTKELPEEEKESDTKSEEMEEKNKKVADKGEAK